MKLLFTIKESSAAIGISRARIYELISVGEIRTCKLGHRTLIRSEELQRFAGSLPDGKQSAGQ